jgi:hypothetical protein
MAVTLNASTSSGLVQTADTSGVLTLQSNGTDAASVSGSNFQFNSGYGSVATAYGCRAWVNFNGTGTVAIRASGNVTSITDNGTGDYTVNFTTALTDANYCVSGSCLGGSSAGSNYLVFGGKNANTSNTQTTTAVQITTSFVSNTSGSSSLFDHQVISVAIFR